MILLALLLLYTLLPPALANPPDLADIGFTRRQGATVGLDLMLRTEAGAPISLRTAIAGRPTVLALGYFRCATLCGVLRGDVLDALSRSGLLAGSDYTLLAVSIDGAENSADAAAARTAEIARYRLPGTADGVHYLTGNAQPIETAVGFHARFDGETKQFLHPTGLVFLTPTGRVSSYLLGVGYQANEVRAGVVRARDDVIAPATPPVLLFCFHFDPATGKYTLAIMRVLQLAAVLTVLVIGGTIVLTFRNERR